MTSPTIVDTPTAPEVVLAPTPGLDSQAMAAAVAAFPHQVARAAQSARGLDGLPEHDDVENVVVLGMGGSAVAGDLMVAAAGPYLPVPAVVVRNYDLPAFVGEGSLVFAVSFSGDTEETVEAATQAALAGARMVVVTQGGALGDLARGWGVPVVDVPADIPQPRAALGALGIPLLVVLEQIGLFPGASHWIESAVNQLEARRAGLFGPDGLASRLARSIGRTMALVHGGGALGAVAAYRWKTQINENAKAPAFWNVHSELGHNEIAGWGQHGDLTRQAMTIVNLRHDYEHPQVMHRFELARQLLSEVVADVVEVTAAGDGELAQLLDLVYIGDAVSVQMAVDAGVDPGPIPAIDWMKEALATAAGEQAGATAVTDGDPR
ncbi:MAG: bifunctional phosphoglucose/phosphomannose isomerase [Acidimicrobiales bacterium]